MHGGSILLKSQQGAGSEFIIEFPDRAVEESYNTSENNQVRESAGIEKINIEFSDIYS